MPNTELVQAEVAVIEAGLVLANVKVGLVEAKIKQVKASLELAAASMAAKVLAIEAEVKAVKENIRMVATKVRLFRSEPGPAVSHAERLSSALRGHIELDNDKLGGALRELEQIERDIRHASFAFAGTR